MSVSPLVKDPPSTLDGAAFLPSGQVKEIGVILDCSFCKMRLDEIFESLPTARPVKDRNLILYKIA
jgi:hypothetical protein